MHLIILIEIFVLIICCLFDVVEREIATGPSYVALRLYMVRDG
jgi:hypothetical protein